MSGVRNAYLGTSEFAATVLRRLSDSEHAPVLVVTPPDRPRGRGRRVQSPPVAEVARELQIDLLQTSSVNEPESLARIRSAKPSVGTVCAFGQLIREPLLSELALLNAHPSSLPRWRGAAPIERAIMAGDRTTGVAVIRLVEALDAGPIALSETTPIGPDESYGELAGRLAAVAGELLVRALDLMAADQLTYTEQGESAATYAEKIAPKERRLDPARPALELAARVRALSPHIGAYLELEGRERLAVSEVSTEAGPAVLGALSFTDELLRLGTADGALVLKRIQPPGGRAMSPAEFLRGNELPERVTTGAAPEA